MTDYHIREAAESLLSTVSNPNYRTISHSQSVNIVSEELVAGHRPHGKMSTVRRFFCLFVTFDLLFTSLMWLICVMMRGETLEQIFDREIVHYDVKSSLFDIVMVAITRFTMLLLFYALLYINNWSVIALSTGGTCALLIAKVFVFDWPNASQPVYQVFLILTSFTLAWGEAWFLDFRVLPQELQAKEILECITSHGAAASASERAPLLAAPRGPPSAYGESTVNWFSPVETPEASPRPRRAGEPVILTQDQLPSHPESWLDVEKGFKFPRCVGAIDGKHIVIQCPALSGSEYYDYKKSFSIVLLALVDSDFKFLYADIGSQGRISDGGVFRNSLLWQKICSNNLNLPPPCPLPGLSRDVPYVFLGDGAFALSTHIMKPYPGDHNAGSPKRVFNNRLSSSRVVVENAFGILASKFRIFRKPILLDHEKTSLLTMTTILLHNFLRKSETSRKIYTPPGSTDVFDDNDQLVHLGTWRDEIAEFQETCAIRSLAHMARRPSINATQIREEFTTYLSNSSNTNSN